MMDIKQILERAQTDIIARSDSSNYTLSEHIRDLDLIAELTQLKIKYCSNQFESSSNLGGN